MMAFCAADAILPLQTTILSTNLLSSPKIIQRLSAVGLTLYNNANPGSHRLIRSFSFPASASTSNSTSPDVSLSPQGKSFTLSTIPGSSWQEFAKNVSGEWDGFGADFTNDGKPIELPESVVPEAFREWEVKVFDWQTQCPTLAQHDDFLLQYKVIRLLPTVGCEADAATRYSVDERSISSNNEQVSAFAYQSSGCYVAVWNDVEWMELEHCLIDPRDKESRVRIIQLVHFQNDKLELRNIRVFTEQWYGPFRNGDQLGGCAIRDTAFASTKALDSSLVTGAWQGSSAIARFSSPHNNVIQELLNDGLQESVRNEDNLVLLPKQLWSSLKEVGNGDIYSEVGWLLDQGQAITSRCIFSTGLGIGEIVISRETRL